VQATPFLLAEIPDDEFGKRLGERMVMLK